MRNTRWMKIPDGGVAGFNAINSMRNTRAQLESSPRPRAVSTLLIACAIRALGEVCGRYRNCFNAINSMRNTRHGREEDNGGRIRFQRY